MQFTGLVTDVSPVLQPENTYTFALNAVMTTLEGNRKALTTEPGTSEVLQMGLGEAIIGSVLLEDNSVVLFITNDIDSKIGILQNDNFTVLLNETCLNFKREFPIQAEYRVINGCERIIYFVDGNNPDRSINLDNLSQYYTVGVFNCDLIKLHINYQAPTVIVNGVIPTGGVNVEVGAYQFAFAYEDKSGNVTNYFSITNPVTVSFEDDEGGQNINAGFSEEDGGVPATNKSIALTISDLDTKFSKLQIVAIKSTNGDQVSSAYIIDRIPISSSVFNYVFTGVGNSEQIDVGSVVVENVVYDSSKIIHVSNNRLLRANLKAKERNWALFQQEANQIQLRWVAKESREYQNDPSYCYDEVYAFGIKWVFKDGTESPVFHIPGRQKDKYADGSAIVLPTDPNKHPRLNPNPGQGWDTSTYNNMDSLGQTLERWQVYNTAIRDIVPVSGAIASGEMSYYETTTDYPDIEDCNEDRIYPDGKIRHHKFPDTALVDFFSTNFPTTPFYVLGVYADNVITPAGYTDDVVGYKIVRAKRDSLNRTVLDVGILYGTYRYVSTTNPSVQPDFYFQRPRYNGSYWSKSATKINKTLSNCKGNIAGEAVWFPVGADAGDSIAFHNALHVPDTDEYSVVDYMAFHGVESKFNPSYLGATHFKIEGRVLGVSEDFVCHVEYEANYGNANNDVCAEALTYNTFEHPKIIPGDTVKEEGYTNCPISYQRNVNTKSKLILDNGKNFINYSSSETYIIKPDCTQLQKDKYALLEDTSTSQNHEAFFVALKRTNENIHSNLDTIQYIETSPNLTNGLFSYGGDVYCSFLSTRLTMDAVRFDAGLFSAKDYGFLRNLVTYPVYSEINTFLRHDGEGTNCNKVYPMSFSSPEDYLFMEKYIASDLDAWKVKPTYLCANYYGYNQDYSKQNDIKAYFPVPSNYDYCLECAGNYPNRIIWSETASEEGFGEDNYRVYLANNYLDITSNSGELNALSSYNSNIFAFTDKQVVQLYNGNRELQTNDGTVYVGSGAFLSEPPTEGMLVPYGHGGTKSRFSIKRTEFGIFYIDHMGAKVIQLSDGMKPISSNGNEMFFRKNLNNDYLVNYFKNKGLNYKFDDILTHWGGVGTIVTYDPMYKRILIHHRDFKPLVDIKLSTDSLTTGNYFIDVTTHLIYRKDLLSNEQVYLHDIDLFENKSFTMSYSCIDDAWVSYHAWSWGHSFNTDKSLYVVSTNASPISSDNLNKFTENGLRLLYYDVPSPFIIEYAIPSLPTQTLESIHYVSRVTSYLSTDIIDLDQTFNGLVVYNSYQNSGFLNISVKTNPYDGYRWNSFTKYASRKDRVWRVSGFRNNVEDITLPSNTSDWEELKSIYSLYPFQGYIDKVPNSAAINADKPQQLQEMFRDNYNKIRHFYYGVDKLEIELTSTNQLKSIR